MGIEVIVGEEDYVATYKNGLKTAKDYWTAHNSTGGLYSIARALSRHPTTVKQWLKKGVKPDCIRGLEHAKKLGIVPLTCTSEKIEALNRLISWTFWTGFVAQSYTVMICEAPEQVKTLQKYFHDMLGIESEFLERQGIRFNGDSHTYGRLLYCMGIPIGDRKSTHELHVPRSINCSPDSRMDFLRVLFATRTDQTGKYWMINLLSNRTEERAHQFGHEILAFMNETLPSLKLSNDQLTVLTRTIPSGYKKDNQNKVYEPRIAMHKENMVNLVKYYPLLVSVKPQTVSYH